LKKAMAANPPTFGSSGSWPESSYGGEFVANFMPNRAYTRIWRGVAVFCLAITGLMALTISSEASAHRGWERASGKILAAELKHADEENSPGGIPGKLRTLYWAAFDIEFKRTTDYRTGAAWAPGTHGDFPCIASLHSPPSTSWSVANRWLLRHPLNSDVRIFYDPKGAGAVFADESVWNLWPWDKIFAMLGIGAFGSLMFAAAQKRLRALAYLPPGEDLPPPPSEQARPPDELIDLNLH
jgi:hypothetical protein